MVSSESLFTSFEECVIDVDCFVDIAAVSAHVCDECN
jgi:hypothetical protein